MTEHGSRLICLPSPLVAVQPCQRMISILPRFDGWYWSTYRTPSGSAGGHARSVKGAASPAATSKVPGEQTQQHPVFRHSRRRSLFRYSKCLTFLRRKGRCLKDRTKPDLESEEHSPSASGMYIAGKKFYLEIIHGSGG